MPECYKKNLQLARRSVQRYDSQLFDSAVAAPAFVYAPAVSVKNKTEYPPANIILN